MTDPHANHAVIRRPGAREYHYCLTCGERIPLPLARPRWLDRAAKDLTGQIREVQS